MALIVLPDNTTLETTLDDLLSRSPYTLLYFYPKDNTPGCTTEAQDFSSLQDQFAELDVQVVWVSKDSTSSHCNFRDKHELTIPLLSDPDLTLHKQFGARGEKNIYGKVKEGVIRSTSLLDQSGTTIHSWTNVKAKWHAERVLRELPGLLDK
jgi:peroxiredoxin Q/BCP